MNKEDPKKYWRQGMVLMAGTLIITSGPMENLIEKYTGEKIHHNLEQDSNRPSSVNYDLPYTTASGSSVISANFGGWAK